MNAHIYLCNVFMSIYLLSAYLPNFVASYVLTTYMCSVWYVRIIYYFPCSYNVGSYYVSAIFELAHALVLLLCELAKYILYRNAVNYSMYVLAMYVCYGKILAQIQECSYYVCSFLGYVNH
jgi:hypothetical protein